MATVVKQASGHRNAMNLPSTHVTTFEFGQVRPTYYRFLDAKEKIKVTPSMLVRTAPLTYPMFGDAQFVHRGFFVPHRLISPKFQDFYEHRKVNVDGVMRDVYEPHFTVGSLLRLITCDTKKRDGSTSLAQGYLGEDIRRYYDIDSAHTLGGRDWNISDNGAYFLVTDSSATTNRKYKVNQTSDRDTHYYTSSWVRNAFIRVKVACRNAAGSAGFTLAEIQERSISFNPSFGYDFVYWLKQGDDYYPVFAQLTSFGRFFLKVMNSLGYKLTFPFQRPDGVKDFTSLTHIEDIYDDYRNGFAILSFLRVIMDNYVPTQFVPSSVFSEIFNFITTPGVYTIETSLDLASSSNVHLYGKVFLQALHYAWQVTAGSDYFTDAWYNENSIIDGQFGDMSAVKRFSDVTGFDGTRGLDSSINVAKNGTKFAMSGTPTGPQINDNTTEDTHTWMRALHNWILRSNLAGSKAVSNILAVFGIRPSAARLDVAEYCGKRVNSLNVQDVTSTTTTQGSDGQDLAVLGEYAGKSWSVLDKVKGFEYECDEAGIFFVLSSVVNHGGYVQGVDRHNMISDWQDWYHPEFEKTGNQPIAVSELLAAPTRVNPVGYDTDKETGASDFSYNYFSKAIFGFCPRYGFMKYGRDYLTGDFNVRHLGGGADGELQGYHMFRLFANPNDRDEGLFQLSPSSHSLQRIRPVAQGEILYDDGKQYNRIFNVTDSEQDHMFAVMRFEVSLFTSKLPINKSFDLDGFNEVPTESEAFD